METIQIVEEAPVRVLDTHIVIEKAPEVAHSLGRAMLTGVEARLAQAANLTANVRPHRLPYFAA